MTVLRHHTNTGKKGMCIILFAWQQPAQPALVVAANRDEFHHRPAEAARWRGDMLCGLDLVAGGTWLGLTRDGRFAAVTNYREPVTDRSQGNRSRGMLPMGFLQGGLSPEAYLDSLVPDQAEYGAFNLLVGNASELWYMSNRGAEPQPVPPGIHALSNGLLDTQWPKTRRGTELMSAALANPWEPDHLLPVLQDEKLPDDGDLPDTGVGLELERLVAPIFIRSATYGTRASTVLALAQEKVQMVEQRWNASGASEGEAARFEHAI